MAQQGQSHETVYQIEILRGVSISLVFLYHIGFFLLPAGFIGVDSFFVISGYLMALLYGRMSSSVDVWKFYAKRLNRLLPAYFTVLFLTICAGTFILLPFEFADTVRYSIYAALLAPNIGFWLDASYFDNSFFRCFLNLWSLGVELQFYLIFPLIVYLSRKKMWLVVLLSFVSFALCFLVVDISPKTSFFMMPLRIWEFMLGVFAVSSWWVNADEKLTRVYRAIESMLVRLTPYRYLLGSLALVALIACAASSVHETEHPKWIAFIVCMCTLIIIRAGLPNAFIRSVFGRGFIVLGTYSYSIYLVHFPIIAFLKYQPFGTFFAGTLTVPEVIAAVLLTGVSASALYHFIEIPLRRGFFGRFNLLSYGAVAILLILILPIFTNINERKYTPETLDILQGWADRGSYRCGKIDRLLHPTAQTCVVEKGSGLRYLLVGNSHADAIKVSLAAAAFSHDAELSMMSENCALGEGSCAVNNIRAIMLGQHFDAIILHSHPDSVHPAAIQELVNDADTDGFQVIFLDPVPIWQESVVQALYEHAVDGTPLPVQTIAEYRTYNATNLHILSAISNAHFTRYETEAYFCNPDCLLSDASGRHPFYFDSNHLTLTGARALAPLFNLLFSKNAPTRR